METRGQSPEKGKAMRMHRIAVLKMGPGRGTEESRELGLDVQLPSIVSIHGTPWRVSHTQGPSHSAWL